MLFFARKPKTEEITRKMVHILGVLLIPAMHVFGKLNTAAFCALASIFLIFYPLAQERLEHRLVRHVTRRVNGLINFMERKAEKKLLIRYAGAVYFFLASAAVIFIFPIGIASVSIAVLSLGDGFAALVGGLWGKHKFSFHKNRSWEGSLAFFAASLAGTMYLTNPVAAIMASLVGALVEILPVGIDDNVSVPIAVALFLKLYGL
ncbi:MAG: diacylglycerol/polyprenol kinase family protein [Candidatus Aenigmatarchaeota archaeon]